MTVTLPLKPHRLRNVLGTVGNGVSLGVLLLVLTAAVLTIVVPKVIGAVPLTVLSPSMEPAMPTGNLSVVMPTMRLDPLTDIRTLNAASIRSFNKVAELKAGDVIAFQPQAGDATIIMHRIVSVTVHGKDSSRTFTTKGDNNDKPDAPVADYQVRGKVIYSLRWLGYVNTFVNHGDRRAVVIVMVAAVGYIWALLTLINGFRRRKHNEASKSF